MRLALLCLFALTACGPMRPTSDAGPTVDDSCGIDCVAQKRFNIIANRCFEYSTSDTSKIDPPKLGVFVKPVATLEGGIKVMPLEYREGGQTLMLDNFTFENGALKLIRREFPRQGRSVTFRNEAMAITGVTWLAADFGPGQAQTSAGQADNVDQAGMHMYEASTYRVSTRAATAQELKTPLKEYPSALRMLTSQMPDRGADPLRTFVPDEGFISISSAFNFAGGNPTAVHLQRVRDVGASDPACSLGMP